MKNKRKRITTSSSCSDDNVPLTIIKRNGYAEDPNSSDSSDQQSDENVPLKIIKMNGHSKHPNSSDSLCPYSDEDDPLITIKMNGYNEDPNCYDSLCQQSIEPCEFCDKVSENRYSSLIHNMRHIIIPLLNQTVYQCHICLHHFTSQEDLRMHKLRKHLHFNTIPQVQLVKNEHLEFFQALPRMNATVPKNNSVQIIGDCKPKQNDLVSIREKDVPKRIAIQIVGDDLNACESYPKLATSLKRRKSVCFKEYEQVVMAKCNLNNVPKRESPIEIIDLDEYDENEPNLHLNTNTDGPRVESMKNRLLFEDDIVSNSDRLLNDLTTDCKVNLEVFKPPWLDDEFVGKSVHFDELVKPGVYRCKKCSKGFPIRYDAIVHESSHITIKNSQITLCRMCNQYILGNKNNLRLHYLSNHKQKPSEDHRQTQNSKFKTDITNSKLLFDEEKTEEFDDKKVLISKILKLCDLCYSFCKNKPPMITYVLVGSANELGKRYRCEKCGSKFFDVKIVRRDFRRNMYSFKKKKHMSNEDRLKIIKHRFKMMKN